MSVKLPSFKIIFDASETQSPGELFSTLTFGFGLLWAWYSITLYSNFTIQRMNNLVFPDFVPYMSLVCFTLTALIIMCFTKHASTFLLSKGTSILASACCAAGTLCILLTSFFPPLATIALIVSGIFSGFGGGSLFVLWGAEYSKRNASSSALNTAFALCTGIIIFVVASLFGSLVTTVTAVIAALLGIPFLLNSQHQTDSNTKHPYSKVSTTRAVFILRIGLAAIPLGFALGVLRNIFFLSFERGHESYSYCAVLVMACFSVLFVVLGVLLAKKTDEYGSLLKPFLFIVALAVIIIPLFNITTQQNSFPDYMLLVCYLSFEVCVWVFFAQVSFAFHLSPFFVFGIGETFVCIGKFAEMLVQSSVVSSFGVTSLFDIGIAALVLFALLTGFCLIPSEKEVEQMVVDGGWTTDNKDRPGFFQACCEYISATYALSNRESEILLYLAKGRNAAYIQEKLVISEGTVKTHIWRIYRKLDVHTQQELINLVEAVDVE